MLEFSHIFDLLCSLHGKVDIVINQLAHIKRELHMAADKLATLEQDVADNDTVVGSIETLVNNLVTQLAAAQASPDSDARIQAIIDKLGADKTRLAALVTANTPADTGQTPPPATPPPTGTSGTDGTSATDTPPPDAPPPGSTT
ncbi:MAG TPA: hypothetical protein VGH62_11990 [Bradyrhizobium sp.]|jgi:septal ring factor EnvC (AmiA/AmiB activator)